MLQLLGSPQGRRARAYHEHITAFVTAAGAAAGGRTLAATASDAERAFDDLATSNDHLAPLATLGLADAATPPRLRMLERTPSGSADDDPASRAGSAGGTGGAAGSGRGRGAAAKRAVAVSARHIAHGSYVAGRALLWHALLPAARASCAASCAVAAATCTAAVATGRAVAGAAGGVLRFASAPRVRVAGFDGEQAAAGAGGVLATAHGGVSSPEPISNLVGGRIRLASCRATRLRVEYCRDCVLMATGLQDCELLLVGCSQLRLVLRGCSGLVLRELQCSDMGDCVRRRCERFSHEIVCLRCACKPMSGGGGGGWGLGGSGGAGSVQPAPPQQLQPYQQQHYPHQQQQQQQHQLYPVHQQQQQHHFQQFLHRYNSVSSSTSSSAVFQGNGHWH